MVKDSAQIYTIEGIAGGMLMLMTAYLIVSTTSVLTIQDVHIIDMQLEQIGYDALAMMDTPYQAGEESNLSRHINEYNHSGFRSEFLGLLNPTAGVTEDHLNYNATVYYWDTATSTPGNFTFGYGETYYRENAVKVSRWVYIDNPSENLPAAIRDGKPHSLLIEVLLWRG